MFGVSTSENPKRTCWPIFILLRKFRVDAVTALATCHNVARSSVTTNGTKHHMGPLLVLSLQTAYVWNLPTPSFIGNIVRLKAASTPFSPNRNTLSYRVVNLDRDIHRKSSAGDRSCHCMEVNQARRLKVR